MIFKNAKYNPVLGVHEKEGENIISDQMDDNFDTSNQNPSRSTMARHMSEVKVESAMSSGFSTTKLVLKGCTYDHFRKIIAQWIILFDCGIACTFYCYRRIRTLCL